MGLAHQRVLFWPNPLSLELDRVRHHVVTRAIRLSAGKRVGEWLHDAVTVMRIDRIWLDDRSAQVEIEPFGGNEMNLRCFTARFRFLGDERLWNLFPVNYGDGFVGEIDRGHLVLYTIASSQCEAMCDLGVREAGIRNSIKQQCSQIADFEDSIYDHIKLGLEMAAASVH